MVEQPGGASSRTKSKDVLIIKCEAKEMFGGGT
jgi:hypothetical protein